MLKTELLGPKTAKPLSTKQREGESAETLLVSTRPEHALSHKSGFFANQSFGLDMNIDAAFGGTPDQIHDGLDTTLWTGSNVVGSRVTFDSAAQAQEASQSIYFNRILLNNVAQFAKGSDVTMGDYVALTFFVYSANNWAAGDTFDLFFWDTAGGTQIGDSVNLTDYFTTFDTFSVWTPVTIPLSAFGVASSSSIIDALRIQCTGTSGTRPRFYIDQIQLEQTGQTAEFSVEPASNEILYIDVLQLTFRDTYASTDADATLPFLDGDTFLGTTITNGLSYLREDAINGVTTAATVRAPIDILQLPGSFAKGFTDGTQTILQIGNTFDPPLVVDGTVKDKISYTVNDDLSGLDFFRIAYKGKLRNLDNEVK